MRAYRYRCAVLAVGDAEGAVTVWDVASCALLVCCRPRGPGAEGGGGGAPATPGAAGAAGTRVPGHAATNAVLACECALARDAAAVAAATGAAVRIPSPPAGEGGTTVRACACAQAGPVTQLVWHPTEPMFVALTRAGASAWTVTGTHLWTRCGAADDALLGFAFDPFDAARACLATTSGWMCVRVRPGCPRALRGCAVPARGASARPHVRARVRVKACFTYGCA